MSLQTRTLGGLMLGGVALHATQTFLSTPHGPHGSAAKHPAQHTVQLRGAAATGQADGPASASFGTHFAIAGAALVFAGCSVARAAPRTAKSTPPQRASRVVNKALGSIDQFKVFGPKEDPFEIETDKVLGVGGQGTVYLGHRQSAPDKKYAIKTIPIWRLLMDPSSEQKIATIRKETEVLMKIQGHPNVCECLGCFDAFRPGTTAAQYIMIVMELVEGGELASYIKDGQEFLAEDVVRSVVKQTAEGLKFIHDKDVIHRDLKAENILVCAKELTADTTVKLIDFGVAKSVSNTYARSCVGTTGIMAPELVSAKMMIAPKGKSMKTHGPYTFKPPSEASPGFGIVTQRPDGKGAMTNGIEPGGQADKHGVGDGWAISHINGTEILEMPFVKDFNELGAGSSGGVKAIAQILGGLNADFTAEFVELPKREFTKAVDLWSLGVTLYVMLAGMMPFKDELEIVHAEYDESRLAHCSDAAKDLVKGLLRLDPDERLTLDQVLEHPFLKV